MDKVLLDVHLNIEDVTRKAEQLVELLKEAKTLVNDLASDLSNLTFEIKG